MSIQKTILLVEDDEDVLCVFKDILIRNGYNILSTSSPLEAIQIAESYEGEINLLFTDVIMPQMSGMDLSRKLSSIREKMPTLFMSGYFDGILSDGISLDELNFIYKPFSIKALISKVETVMTPPTPQ